MRRTYRFLPVAASFFLGAGVLFAWPDGPSCSCNQPAAPQGEPAAQPVGAEQPAVGEFSAPAENPREAIRKVLDDQVAAWNRGDLNAFMAGYFNSPNLSFFSGKTRTYGWKETLARYRKRYQAEGKEMGKLEFHVYDIDLLSPNIALVRGKYELRMKNNDRPEGLFTLLFGRMADGWRILHDHTSS